MKLEQLEKTGDNLMQYHLPYTFLMGVSLGLLSYLTSYFSTFGAVIFGLGAAVNFILLTVQPKKKEILLHPTSLFELGGVKFLKRAQNKMLLKLKQYHEQFLTTQEIEINETVALFTQSLFRLKRKNARYTHILSHESLFFPEQRKLWAKHQILLTQLYQEHFKNDLILAKCIIQAVEGNSHAKDAFSTFWLIHQETLNLNEIYYINTHLDDIIDVHLLTRGAIFKVLSKKLQEKVLSILSENKDSLYDSLVNCYRETQEAHIKANTHDVQNITFDKIDIRQDSQEQLANFKHSFDVLFDEPKVMDSIYQLFLFREKLSYFLTQFDLHNQYIEMRLFLEQDVEQLLHNFQEEIAILTKMHMTHHTQLEQRKTDTLNSMIERLQLVNTKMNDINEKLHQSMDNELELEVGINQSVLKAKI